MTIRTKIARNRSRPCRHTGCREFRTALSPFCDRHARAVERHGHPEGRAINPKEYAVERQQVAAFLAKHAAHEGLQSSLKWLQRWMDSATLGTERFPAASELRQAAEHGVTPLQILTESAALFLYSRNRPAALPDDVRLDWAVGIRVLTLAPRQRRFGRLHGKPRHYSKDIGKVARRSVGQRIRLTLAPLFTNIVRGIDEEQAEQQREVLSLHQPFARITNRSTSRLAATTEESSPQESKP